MKRKGVVQNHDRVSRSLLVIGRHKLLNLMLIPIFFGLLKLWSVVYSNDSHVLLRICTALFCSVIYYIAYGLSFGSTLLAYRGQDMRAGDLFRYSVNAIPRIFRFILELIVVLLILFLISYALWFFLKGLLSIDPEKFPLKILAIFLYFFSAFFLVMLFVISSSMFIYYAVFSQLIVFYGSSQLLVDPKSKYVNVARDLYGHKWNIFGVMISFITISGLLSTLVLIIGSKKDLISLIFKDVFFIFNTDFALFVIAVNIVYLNTFSSLLFIDIKQRNKVNIDALLNSVIAHFESLNDFKYQGIINSFQEALSRPFALSLPHYYMERGVLTLDSEPEADEPAQDDEHRAQSRAKVTSGEEARPAVSLGQSPTHPLQAREASEPQAQPLPQPQEQTQQPPAQRSQQLPAQKPQRERLQPEPTSPIDLMAKLMRDEARDVSLAREVKSDVITAEKLTAEQTSPIDLMAKLMREEARWSQDGSLGQGEVEPKLWVMPALGLESKHVLHYHRKEKAHRTLAEVCALIEEYPEEKHLIWDKGWEAWQSWRECGFFVVQHS